MKASIIFCSILTYIWSCSCANDFKRILFNKKPHHKSWIMYNQCEESNSEEEILEGDQPSAKSMPKVPNYFMNKHYFLKMFQNVSGNALDCEYVNSFIAASNSYYRSTDLLEFSTIELFSYSNHFSHSKPSVDTNNMSTIMQTAKFLQSSSSELINTQHNVHSNSNAFARTIVVMPFFGNLLDDNRANLASRLLFLESSFWSFHAYFPHIVIGVADPQDAELVRNSSLPYTELIYLEEKQNFTHCNLPISLQHVVFSRLHGSTSEELEPSIDDSKRMLTTINRNNQHPNFPKSKQLDTRKKNIWKNCKHLFFANFDQILLLKSPHRLVAHLQRNPEHILQPHLLKAFSAQMIKVLYQREPSYSQHFAWMQHHCCVRPPHGATNDSHDSSIISKDLCHRDDEDLVELSNSEAIPVLRIFGLQVPLGEHKLMHYYQACSAAQHALHGHGNAFCTG